MNKKNAFIYKKICFLIMLFVFFMIQPLNTSAIIEDAAAEQYPWRGMLLGAEHGSCDIHYDNIYIQLNGDGPVIYQTSIPARRTCSENEHPDQGLLWHFFTQNNAAYTFYAVSTDYGELSSELSALFTLDFSYDSYDECTEQTVPVAVAGQDRIVQVSEEVTLDASNSYDSFADDTSNLVYRWTCFSAPEEVTLSNDEKTDSTSFTPHTIGHYYFRLNVRDSVGGNNYNRSPVDYVRISVVDDHEDPYLLDANAGRMQQAETGATVTLDGSKSRGPEGSTYLWEQINPIDLQDIDNMADVLGTTNCNGECYQVNFDADSDVDGLDIPLLANNWGTVNIIDADQKRAEFTAAIARPHIFKLTVEDPSDNSSSETTIVAVNHPNVSVVLTPPEVDGYCLR